jgi:hypothetical protein
MNALTSLFGNLPETKKDDGDYEHAIAMQALRQIRSLDAKNVTKYAQVIARDALARIEKHE